MIFSELIIGSW